MSPSSRFPPPLSSLKVWEGYNAVRSGRKLLGETRPDDSLPGTIRGDFCVEVGR